MFPSSDALTKTVTRAELFNLVWNEPMRTLAPKFGLSDVGLAKLCRRNAIPRPPVGYWATREGKRRRPKLPSATVNQNETILITPSEIRKVDATSDLPKDISDLVTSLNRAEVTVPATCRRSYAMFEEWDASVRQDPWLSNRRPSLSPIEKRRRRILFALTRQIEKWDGRLISVDQHRFKVEFGKDDVTFTLREPSNKIDRPLTQQERRWWPDRRTTPDLRPSGKLRLLIEAYFDRPIQKSWSDLEGKPLESRLHDVLLGLLIALAEDRRRRLHREEEERLRRLREQEWFEFEQRRRAEEEKIQELRNEAAAWSEAITIRSYIVAKLERIGDDDGSRTAVEPWANWATTVADSMDPLLQGTPKLQHSDLGRSLPEPETPLL